MSSALFADVDDSEEDLFGSGSAKKSVVKDAKLFDDDPVIPARKRHERKDHESIFASDPPSTSGTTFDHGGDIFTADPPSTSGGDLFSADPPSTSGGDLFTADPPSTSGGDIFTADPPSTSGGDLFTADPPSTSGGDIFTADPPSTSGGDLFTADPPSTSGTTFDHGGDISAEVEREDSQSPLEKHPIEGPSDGHLFGDLPDVHTKETHDDFVMVSHDDVPSVQDAEKILQLTEESKKDESTEKESTSSDPHFSKELTGYEERARNRRQNRQMKAEAGERTTPSPDEWKGSEQPRGRVGSVTSKKVVTLSHSRTSSSRESTPEPSSKEEPDSLHSTDKEKDAQQQIAALTLQVKQLQSENASLRERLEQEVKEFKTRVQELEEELKRKDTELGEAKKSPLPPKPDPKRMERRKSHELKPTVYKKPESPVHKRAEIAHKRADIHKRAEVHAHKKLETSVVHKRGEVHGIRKKPDKLGHKKPEKVKAEEGQVKLEQKAEEDKAEKEHVEIKVREEELKAGEGEVKAVDDVKAGEGEVKAEEGELKAAEGEPKAEEGEPKAEEGEPKVGEGGVKAAEEELKVVEEAEVAVKKADQKSPKLAARKKRPSSADCPKVKSRAGVHRENTGSVADTVKRFSVAGAAGSPEVKRVVRKQVSKKSDLAETDKTKSTAAVKHSPSARRKAEATEAKEKTAVSTKPPQVPKPAEEAEVVKGKETKAEPPPDKKDKIPTPKKPSRPPGITRQDSAGKTPTSPSHKPPHHPKLVSSGRKKSESELDTTEAKTDHPAAAAMEDTTNKPRGPMIIEAQAEIEVSWAVHSHSVNGEDTDEGREKSPAEKKAEQLELAKIKAKETLLKEIAPLAVMIEQEKIKAREMVTRDIVAKQVTVEVAPQPEPVPQAHQQPALEQVPQAHQQPALKQVPQAHQQPALKQAPQKQQIPRHPEPPPSPVVEEVVVALPVVVQEQPQEPSPQDGVSNDDDSVRSLKLISMFETKAGTQNAVQDTPPWKKNLRSELKTKPDNSPEPEAVAEPVVSGGDSARSNDLAVLNRPLRHIKSSSTSNLFDEPEEDKEEPTTDVPATEDTPGRRQPPDEKPFRRQLPDIQFLAKGTEGVKTPEKVTVRRFASVGDVSQPQEDKRGFSTFDRKNRTSWMQNKREECAVCTKTVYAMERLEADTVVYHKTCFKCCVCSKTLGVGTYAALQGHIYCKVHFKQLFKMKGNYDEGFGREQHKTKWIKKNGD